MIVKFWGAFGGVETFCLNVLAAARLHSRHVYDMFVFDRIDEAGRARAPTQTRFHPGRRGLAAILWQLWRSPCDVVVINQPLAAATMSVHWCSECTARSRSAAYPPPSPSASTWT